jgi:NADP-dependent 3-hydroxy acid dehydrogenase YdfG
MQHLGKRTQSYFYMVVLVTTVTGFEVSTAQELANNGFYVIVYDRRRRSLDMLMQSLLFRTLMILMVSLKFTI